MKDIDWKQELLDSQKFNKKEEQLLKNGAKSLTDSWYLGALYVRYKRLKELRMIQKKITINFNHHSRNLKEKI